MNPSTTRRRHRSRVAATIALIGIISSLGISAAGASSGDVDCGDFPLAGGPGSEHLILGEIIDGDVLVPAGPGCAIVDSHVAGDVIVAEGTQFAGLFDGTVVDGDVRASNSSVFFWTRSSTVGGDVVLAGGQPEFFGEASVFGRDVRVDSTCESPEVCSTGAFLVDSVVDGNIELGSGIAGALFHSHLGGNYGCDECVLVDIWHSVVEGNVDVLGAPEGFLARGATIDGNVSVDDSGNFFAIDGQSTVSGNVTGRDNNGRWSIKDSTIGGNVRLTGNTLTEVSLPDCSLFPCTTELSTNQIDGHLTLSQNDGAQASISDNEIGGQMKCKSNQPPPAGGGNDAHKLTGQCESL